MDKLCEAFLDAWLDASSRMSIFKIGNELTYNEAHVCYLLYKEQRDSGDSRLTATLLCERTQILKSQMNKILSALEERGLISRVRANDDRRKYYVILTEKGTACFSVMHKHSMQFTSNLIKEVGEVNIKKLVDVLNRCAVSNTICNCGKN